MLNQVVLVGRIVKTPELKITETGKKTSKMTLAVPRNYKNMDGEYDTDFLDKLELFKMKMEQRKKELK